MGASFRIGVDLGGTKIEAAALDGAGNIRLRRRMATPTGDYDRTVAAVAGLVDEIERELGERATVGVGIPGTIVEATGLVKNANSTWLIGRPLARDVEQALDRPVRFANDANCFALSEAADGAAAGCRRSGLRGMPRPLCRPPRPRAGNRYQPPRSRRHRARRWPVATRFSLRGGAAPLGPAYPLRHNRHPIVAAAPRRFEWRTRRRLA